MSRSCGLPDCAHPGQRGPGEYRAQVTLVLLPTALAIVLMVHPLAFLNGT